jgi:DNA-binding CsgD family transcriptional regulator
MRHLADVAALTRDPPAQRRLLVDGLNPIFGTNQGFFFVADGWRPGLRPQFAHQTFTTDVDPVFLQYAEDFGRRLALQADPFCDRSLTDPRALQTRQVADVLPDRAARLRYPEFVDLRRSGRVADGAVSLYRDGAHAGGRVVGVGFHRFGDERKLSARQVKLVAFAVAELRRLAARGHLRLPPGPDDGPDELPPRLRQVQARLLAGRSPKAMARELGLSVWTVREHVQRLYRRHGVNGRDELMARFVRA